MKKFLKKIDYCHYICVGITLVFMLISGLCFPYAFPRLFEALRDFGLSLAYYFTELFGFENAVVPSVTSMTKMPFTLTDRIPITWDEFKIKWALYWQAFADAQNFSDFLLTFRKELLILSYVVTFLTPLVVVFGIIISNALKKQNIRYNADTKQLRIFRKASDKFYDPVKAWLVSFLAFVRDFRFVFPQMSKPKPGDISKPKELSYLEIWAFIWVLNFNFIAIVFEALAYYYYFVVEFDVGSIYTQFYKLLLDLSVMFKAVPAPVWVAVGFFVFDRIRKSIAYKVLNHNEMKDRGFINERPIVFMVCGTMGKKKTTLITDMALSQEVMFRDKALERLTANDMKFPDFPWINLENTLKSAMALHIVYNLATVRKFVDRLCLYWTTAAETPAYRRALRKHLKKVFPFVNFKNLLFDYDFEKFGLYHDDKLKVESIWEVIETYAQLYFIYVIESSLIISNYSIRTDNLMDDIGNFPLWDNDFFHKDSKEVGNDSRHSHILDFDTLRLGLRLVEDNINADNFEFGVINITEIGKERGNMVELQDKLKKAETANQKNDLFNSWLKMVRHSATVDNFPFVRVITDEQRPESWGADARALCEIVSIRSTGDMKLAMPFFAIAEMLYEIFYGRFVNLYLKYRYNRGDNTLTMHLLKMLASKITNYYVGIYNRFGYVTLDMQVESGTQDGEIEDRKYFLSSKKIYSKRFSTDCFSDFFTEKALRSPVGLDDLREYATEKANMDELQAQNSYFVNDLTKTFKR